MGNELKEQVGKELIRNVVAVERDGMDMRTLTIPLKVPDADFDVMDAVRKACTYYVTKTDEGRKVFAYNCNEFNWADFESNVPNDICRMFGFEKLESCGSDCIADWDEELVDQPFDEEE